MQKNTYSIEVGSPVDYEYVVVYIYTNRQCIKTVFYKDLGKTVNHIRHDEVAFLHQEEGRDKVKIKFSDYVIGEELYLDDLLKTLQEAKEFLIGPPLCDGELSTAARDLHAQGGGGGDSSLENIEFSYETQNEVAEKVLTDILNSKNASTEFLANGTKNVYDELTGRGVNISRDGLFNGFREYKKSAMNQILDKQNVFEIEIGSPPDYEQLVAYINTNRKPCDYTYLETKRRNIKSFTLDDVALLDQEEGKDKVKIKFSDYVVGKEIYLDDLLKVLQEAKEFLIGP